MTRTRTIFCGVAIACLALTSAATTAQAQSDTGGALLAYKEGVTPEKEKTDRAACHEWAVEQTGFDPTAIYQAQMAGVKTRTILKVTEKLDAASGFTDPRWGGGGFAGARGSADVRRLNALYEEYLAAGALCLEGRGYTVMSKGGE